MNSDPTTPGGSLEQLVVSQPQTGERLDRFLTQALPGVSVQSARGWIASGCVRIRGKVCKPLRRVHAGDVVIVERPQLAAARRAPGAWQFPLLHDSEAVVVVNKPPGISVEPNRPDEPSVITSLAAQLPGWNVGGRCEPGVVHRLDKDTSGALMFARTDAAAAALRQSFERDEVKKTYWAVVVGNPPREGRLAGPFGRDPQNPRRYTTRVRSARRASLSFRRLAVSSGLALLEVGLETGRTHQIRVQLSESGWPVLGDALYVTDESHQRSLAERWSRQALHARQLEFPDPVAGRVTAVADPPLDFGSLVARIQATHREPG